MRMKVAIFGSEEFCKRAVQYTDQRSEVILDCYPYAIPSEAPELLKSLLPCDAILFSGSLPYVASINVLETIPIPAFYLKQNETEIATTLLAISLQEGLKLHETSIDVRNADVLDNVLSDIDKMDQRPLVYELKEDYLLEDIIQFHVASYQRKETILAITSVHAAYDRLVELNIPVVKMINVKSSFLATLDQVCQEALLHKSETSKIAAGILELPSSPSVSEGTYELLAKLLHAHFIEADEGILFYTTQGAIQSARYIPEFVEITTQFSGNLAFGSGHTLTAAKENAVSALRYMQFEKQVGVYLLDEKKELHNLLESAADPVELRVIEPFLTEIAEKTALSPAVLSKLSSFGQSHQSTQFTANDLANHLDVSRRTAERTIKKLLNNNYAHAVGEEMTYRQGRPRAVYELSFPVY
ncbi:HTH domain-containing protein [Sporosarcina aquimarina]|uniref:HTH domain-containing protein n=1 Tax=Sporosarcina aquimarina TaxID=114975 RepID=A0ABU4G029_9BACL|nr:HTH domain-containing protein [Sporosarcina aquimarina]MDW0110246.1 HTH domain-containing protein [Sporosarcina aquimarina]